MTTVRYFLCQIMIWFFVFIPLSLLPQYNGVTWAYSLAYGALFILPLCLFRHDKNTLICVCTALLAWGYGRFVELSQNPASIELFPHILAMVAVVCLLCERYLMMGFAVACCLYAVRLSAVEPSYLQQGLFNILFISLAIVPGIRTSHEHTYTQKSSPIEYKEAA